MACAVVSQAAAAATHGSTVCYSCKQRCKNSAGSCCSTASSPEEAPGHRLTRIPTHCSSCGCCGCRNSKICRTSTTPSISGLPAPAGRALACLPILNAYQKLKVERTAVSRALNNVGYRMQACEPTIHAFTSKLALKRLRHTYSARWVFCC